MMKTLRTPSVLLLLILWFGSIASAQDSADPVFDANGFQQGHDYFSALPFEHIDTATGALILTFTDLVLPGNAGRELRFQRTYNSKDQSWTFGVAGLPLFVTDWLLGYRGEDQPLPRFYTSDGGQQVARVPLGLQTETNLVLHEGTMVTDRLWKYNRSTRRLSRPDGTVTEYDAAGRAFRQTDAFGNTIDIEWAANPVGTGSTMTVTQDLDEEGTAEERVVVVHFPEVPSCNVVGAPYPCRPIPTSLFFEGRTWNYGTRFDVVTPPAGAGEPWRISYEAAGTLGITVTTPYGGRIQYSFEELFYEQRLPGGDIELRDTTVVRYRDMIDPQDQPVGHWIYEYTPLVADLSSTKTTVTAPDGTETIFDYGHNAVAGGSGYTNPFQSTGHRLKTRTVKKEGITLETEELAYGLVPIPSNTVTHATPELISRTITRFDGGSRVYTTTHDYESTYFGDYHHPHVVTERVNGVVQRTTTRAYNHLLSPYVVGLPIAETVTIDSASVTNAWEYDGDGFRTSETVAGIKTTFISDGVGNVAAATKANGTSTEFTYKWGRVKTVTMPKPGSTITRGVNTDGTIASVMRGGRTTSYDYDDVGRVTLIDPPGNSAETTMVYEDASRRVTVTRGKSRIVTEFDGFGRVVATEDANSVKTKIEYDAQGRVALKTLPYEGDFNTATTAKTTMEYDGLGRPKKETHADGKYRQYSYSGDTVTIRDENDRDTVLTRQAFGHPDDVRLLTVTDAHGELWSYTYGVGSQLRKVAAPGGIERSWAYDAKQLLRTETHPESGTVNYDDYDLAGLLRKKTDAKNQVTTYEYDDNDRLESIVSGMSVTTITYEPGTDKRASTTADGVASTFTYDTAGRLASRTDVVDGKSFAVEFDYDDNDNLEQVTYPSGRKVKYEYGFEGRLIRVFNPDTQTNYATAFGYHPSGALETYTAGNDITTTIDYDPLRYWVRRISADAMVFAYNDYDGVGNVGTITDLRPDVNSRFSQALTYDDLDRLAAAEGPYGTATFDYDAHGNRQVPGTYVYQASTLRLQSIDGGVSTLSYDNNGNLGAGPNATFTYTPANLLATSHVGSTHVAFAYDADAWRVKKAVQNGATAYYARGPEGQLLMEWINSSPVATVREYIYAGSRLIAVMKGDVAPR